VRRKTFQQINL